ncbi:rhomboid family intramembrane serine protease [Aliidiomarina soli]|uniref:Rhomboid family intramembrane serine protease n=1 Tax=Aliidiomarina soli TaxID=1928574 RepID=A0A432WJR7_9GAMM|nr:rhomboid family intramembrane serine protease [Aliidiomarina soli]RUO33929.1 rhomboid family intramembrane serine protease [Aliidiomarina soli]
MKKLTTSSDTAKIARLRQFMLRHGVPVSVSESAGKLDLWVVDDGYYETALSLLDQFVDDPADNTQVPSQGSVLGPTINSLSQQAGLLTFVVFLVTLAVAGLQFLWSMDGVFAALMITPVGTNELDFTQPWRLITPAFIHLSATHLLFNLFWWWYLGGRIELRFGAAHLALIFLLTGVSANLAQWYTSGPLFGGLSGVVYGLLGFCAVYGWQRQNSLTLPNALLVFMVAWLVLGYTNLLWVNMANEAHLFGLLSGVLLGFIYRLRY